MVVQVLPWECPLYKQVATALEESGRTGTSYYALVRACLEECQRRQRDER